MEAPGKYNIAAATAGTLPSVRSHPLMLTAGIYSVKSVSSLKGTFAIIQGAPISQQSLWRLSSNPATGHPAVPCHELALPGVRVSYVS